MPAIKIDKKILVIKGYDDEIDVDYFEIIEDVDSENIHILEIDKKEIDKKDTNDTTISQTSVEIKIDENNDHKFLDEKGSIQEYEVVSGDTIEKIAEKFNVTPETILWANDLKKTSQIHVGQKIVIIPVSGASYLIKSGDTISQISEKFNISQKELIEFNKLEDGKIQIGEVIIIPGAKRSVEKKDKEKEDNKNTKKEDKKNNKKEKKDKGGKNENKRYFIRPVKNGIKTQGIHGHNAVDIASAEGTAIIASADGVVSLIRGGDAWNGGYGNYIVLNHKNGVQTLYAHLSKIEVDKGDKIKQGQKIGEMGNTGRSTGTHLHFEIRGAKNPF